jgi:hypothetical protein
MASAAVHKLFHPHSHREPDPNKQSEQPGQQQTSPHERQDSAMNQAREDEKRSLAQWEDQTHPLSPSQVHDQDQKMVGHSSAVLRQEDFELIKTLGTGAARHFACGHLR